MCVYSLIADDWRDRAGKRFPMPTYPDTWPELPGKAHPLVPASQEDVDALRKELEALKKLLQAAKEYDAATGQPDCEMEEKIAFLRSAAKYAGINLEDAVENVQRESAQKV